MNKQVFANHDFNVVKTGMTSTYSKPPYMEEFKHDSYKGLEFGSDQFFINCTIKKSGRNKKVKIQLF